MIWDGTSPLRPEHEVAYRGWPRGKVEIILSDGAETHRVITVKGGGRHLPNGRYIDDCHESIFDLIPLQQQEQP